MECIDRIEKEEPVQARIQELFRRHGVRCSVQRMAIYAFLCSHPVHPSASAIYEALKESNPALSLTTVYNTMKALVDSGLVKVIAAASGEQYFDADVAFHAHFRCRRCGRIFDLGCAEPAFKDMKGFLLEDVAVECSGICPACCEQLN